MKRVSITTSVVFILVSIYIFLTARTFPPASNGVPGPGFFPMVLSGIVILLSVLLIINECLNKYEGGDKPLGIFAKSNLRVWVALGLTVVYIILINVIGFVVVTPFYLFAIMKYFKVDKLLVNILVSVLTTGALYTVFTILLAVQLPSGILI